MGIMRNSFITLTGICLLFIMVYHIDVKAHMQQEDQAYLDYLVNSIENPEPDLDYSQEAIYLNYLADAVVGSKIHRVDYGQEDKFDEYLVQVIMPEMIKEGRM